MPARVSLLMLPDLGLVARLSQPYRASAVAGRTLDVRPSSVLRVGRSKRLLRWSVSWYLPSNHPTPDLQDKSDFSGVKIVGNLSTCDLSAGCRANLSVEVAALLDRPLLSREVDADNAEALGVAEAPLVVVHE